MKTDGGTTIGKAVFYRNLQTRKIKINPMLYVKIPVANDLPRDSLWKGTLTLHLRFVYWSKMEFVQCKEMCQRIYS